MATLFRLPSACRHVVIVNRSSTFPQCRFSTTTLRQSASRTYADALVLLEKLQSNREVRSAFTGDMNLQAMPEMLAWTRKAGYEVQDIAKHGLKCIHVAGTKGKGSVCVMVESILLQYRRNEGMNLGKVGLYTSPHLVHVRERIRIDGSPISEHLFTKYFFELWDRFSDAAALTDSGIKPQYSDTKPAYFRYLTLMAFHTFIREGVQTAIVECGIGGEYDSTNILPAEAVTATAITPLGIDHAGMLGETIEDIAWHKSGIMKKGVIAYTSVQVPEAQAVLDKRAAEMGVKLSVFSRLASLNDANTKLGLDGDFQKDNGSLAVVLAASHLQTLGIPEVPSPKYILQAQESLPEMFTKGLNSAKWPGRCQHIKDGNTQWFIDGAHTKDSLEAAAAWFSRKVFEATNSSEPPTATMLIFNQQDRDATTLLKELMTCFLKIEDSARQPSSGVSSPLQYSECYSPNIFTYAAFCTNEPFKPAIEGTIDTTTQQAMGKFYSRVDGHQLFMVYESIEEAIDLAHKVSENRDDRVFMFVTGSLHLVGGVLKVLEKKGVDVTARNEGTT